MYSTCLFCNGTLGANEAIETFPVGRRLAFDAAKGRLWVVCRHCERWNLTPLEERWEAIEECERAFRDTRLRVSTDEIGLARLREGLELVRIGAPQRPEMAAWRYGDQFRRRRRRTMLIGGAGVAVVGGYLLAGPLGLGLIGGGSAGLFNIFSGVRTVYRSRVIAARIPVAGGSPLVVQRDQVERSVLTWDAETGRWGLGVRHRAPRDGTVRWWSYDREFRHTQLMGDEAMRAAGLVLPVLNSHGAKRSVVRDAVDYLEAAPTQTSLFDRTARSRTAREHWSSPGKGFALAKLPVHVRLALEMSAHEESERRALEGELHLLESTWREAEEIAAIADDMFLPPSVEEELERLKRLK